MTMLMSLLLSMLPKIFIGLLSKLVTEKFLTDVVGQVVVYLLQKVASHTANTVDDKLVDDVKQAFEGTPATPPPAPPPPFDEGDE